MKASCPNCGEKVEVGDQEHYKMITCPSCQEEFQALGKGTVVSAQSFLELLEKRRQAEQKADQGGDGGESD